MNLLKHIVSKELHNEFIILQKFDNRQPVSFLFSIYFYNSTAVFRPHRAIEPARQSQRHIAARLHVSHNIVAKVVATAKRLLSPSVWEKLSEIELNQQIFPTSAATSVPIMPNFNYIHRELLRNGIALKLLWEKYVDNCRQGNDCCFRYSQFCKRYQNHVE